MYPNVMSIEHGKVPGLRQKVQELQARLDGCQCNIDIFERGGNCSAHFWDLLGSLRGTHDDVCFASICFASIFFASIFIILLFVFVVENGHETCGPWDVQEPRSDETVGPCCFVSCMRRLLTSPRDSKKRWAVNCDRCKYGDNDKSITSMS